MIHPTYRYLERSARLAGLTWRQWVLACTTALATWLLAKVLPFPAPYGATVALTFSGTPAAVAFALAGADVHVGLSPRRLLAFRRARGVYPPGPAHGADGYWVDRDPA